MSLTNFLPTPKFEEYQERFKNHYKLERREDGVLLVQAHTAGAKAFLTTPRTLAQRIVRAKAKIREERIPYEVPTSQELPQRLGAVLQVIYLVFNEGYSSCKGRRARPAHRCRCR